MTEVAMTTFLLAVTLSGVSNKPSMLLVTPLLEYQLRAGNMSICVLHHHPNTAKLCPSDRFSVFKYCCLDETSEP